MEFSQVPLSPPFRADHVGSLLRPTGLLDLRGRVERGDASRDELLQAENAAIADAAKLQQRVGLKLAKRGNMPCARCRAEC